MPIDALDTWVQQAKDDMLRDFHERTKRAAEALIQGTPVRDRGRYRNSFKAEIGNTPTGTDPGRRGDLDQSGQDCLEAIAEVVDAAELGDEVFISSDAPGIQVLEEGGKNCPPARMALAAAMQWADD